MIATVRGQGGTDGFHERSIAIPRGCMSIFGEHPDELAKLARERVDDAGDVRRGVLRTAIFVLLQNAPETSRDAAVRNDAPFRSRRRAHGDAPGRAARRRVGIAWHGRRYERDNPTAADPPNQAINHAASAVEGAAANCGDRHSHYSPTWLHS